MNRIFQSNQPGRTTHRRQGITTPAVAVAMLTVMLGLALILDRIWLETAKLELMTAAESGCLAAARELVSDDILRSNNSINLRLSNARNAASSIASQNVVGGVPVNLNSEADGDIQFGNLVQQPQGIQFVESTSNPNTVVVTALRTRSNNNPVALVLSGMAGIPYADVAVRVEASVENDVVGVRPIIGSPIPALPIAIWDVDSTGNRSDTWDAKINRGGGGDSYGYDTETHSVFAGTDGIPEMVIRSTSATSNLLLLDIGTELGDVEVTRQIETGISVSDLQNFGGAVLVGQGVSASFNSSNQLTSSQAKAFQNLAGEARICFLYSANSAQQISSGNLANCTDMVAIRVMSVNVLSDGSCEMTVQPTVITSRNVILASESSSFSPDAVAFENDQPNAMTSNATSTSGNVIPNPYIYKLRLTH